MVGSERNMPIHCLITIALVLIGLTIPKQAAACEPLVPMAILFGAPVASLYGVILVKALLFGWFDKSMPWFKGSLFMVLANIFSSALGLALGLAAAMPGWLLFVLPFVYFCSIVPSERFITHNPWGVAKQRRSKSLAALVLALYFLTFVLFVFAQSMLDSSLALYWLMKYAYIVIALVVSIGLTALWEEWVISKCSRVEGSHFIPVIKVNLVAFMLIMGFLAAQALPQRLRSADFLI